MFLKILNHTKQRAIWSWEGFLHVLITEKSVYQWVFANVISFLAAMALPISTAERSDLILVFDEGKIVEKGEHSHLVNSKGVYSKLYESWIGNTREV